MRLGIGIIIALILIVYWYMQDYRQVAPPGPQGYLYTYGSGTKVG